MAEMSALDALHRKQKLSGYCRGSRSAATVLFEACYDFPLPLNMPVALGDVPIGCLQNG
jgi:hypothetical protein